MNLKHMFRKKLKVVFDTNIYDFLITESELSEKIIKKFKIYNFSVVKEEIEKTPLNKIDPRVSDTKIRDLLIQTYNLIVTENPIGEDKMIKDLSEEYFNKYKERGGTKVKKTIINDFKIVAFASLYNLDVVISNDDKTMKHKISKRAYDIVNLKYDLRTPNFIDFKTLKEDYCN